MFDQVDQLSKMFYELGNSVVISFGVILVVILLFILVEEPYAGKRFKSQRHAR